MPKSYKMNFLSAIFFIFAVANVLASDCPAKKTTSKLICYYSKLAHVDSCKCSHVILPADADVKSIDRIRGLIKGVKILITVNEFNQGLVNILKSSKVDGIEINLKKLDSKNDISDFISTVRSKLGSDLYIVLSVPAISETLAKYYDFKTLSKNADLFILQTAFLGASKNVTFHPSRLSGLWDMQNTDSVVDLVSGLGAPLSKLVITSPVQAFKFKLQSEKHTAPGSPALEVQSITRDELCNVMGNGGNWTLERDQDQAGPYIFSKNQWIAFDDPTSIDIKAKYSRVRGLAGIALKDLSQDGGTKCKSSILEAAYNGLSRQARAPRGAVLHSLEREILETPGRPLDTVQVSPYRISRVIDVEGNVHVIRKDTRTEFECSRQGYFVHPRSCGRFYRCVKFDQLSDEFSVFEFDCPAGLAFDSRVEVCVWPGSLPHASPCSGSSEIAPVPRQRFVCPNEPGYYADPENCRWFFACLDHGKSPLSAYEFRCPFGLVYDESRLLCEWPWLVPRCGSGYAVGSQIVYGGTGSVALDQYDGLGVLGVTALGGLHGPLVQPVAQIYSNVGHASQGYIAGSGQLSLNAAQSLQNAGLLKGGYVASASLQGSGLGLQYSTGNVAGNIGLKTTQTDGLGLGYVHGQDSSSSYQGAEFGVKLQQAGGLGAIKSQAGDTLLAYQGDGYDQHLASGNAASNLQINNIQHGTNLNYQTDSLLTGTGSIDAAAIGNSQGNAGYVGSSFVTGTDAVGVVKTQANAGYLGGSLLTGTGSSDAVGVVKTQANAGYLGGSLLVGSGNIGTAGLVKTQANTGYVSNGGAHLVNGLAENLNYGQQLEIVADNAQEAYDDVQPSLEYHGNIGSNYGSGTRGKINIVKGGYSAVGVATNGIQATNYGENTNIITHVTQSPVSVATVSSVPIVTAVPVPAIKAASGFQSYNGGVVANVPELQYKVHGNLAASRGNTGFTNISNSFINVVSSTPSTILAKDGYHYSKPTVAFIEEPLRSTISTGTLVQQNVASVQPIVTTYQKPFVVSTTQTPLVAEKVNLQPVVTTYQKPVSTSFVQHVQPVVTFGKTVVSTPSPIIQENINVQPIVTTYQKPAVVSTVQTPLVEQIHIQQPVVSTYNVQKQDASFVGYDYPKPVVKFEETPVQTTGGSFSYQNVDLLQKTRGYTYNKPSVAFEEVPLKTVNQAAVVSTVTHSASSTPKPLTVVEQVQPVVQVQPTIQTVQPIIQQQPVISVSKQEIVQPQLEITSYNVPSSTVKPVVFQQSPQVYVSSTPATVQPVVQQQGAVSFTNFQKHYTVEPQLQVTSYNVPSSTVKPVVVQQTPQVYVSSTPATVQQNAVSFTNFQNHEINQAQIDLGTYNVPSSTIRPIVTPPVIQQKIAQPAIVSSFSISSNNEGYRYENPSVTFEEKPSVVTYQQPIVQKTVITSQPAISTYNYQTPVKVKPAVNTYTYKNVLQSTVNQGYVYDKPAVAFEEVPASVTRFNYEQKPVVSSYNYVAPSTVKPAVYLQKEAPVVTSYTYTAPSTVKPAVFVQQPVVQKVAPVATSYTYTAPSTVKPAVIVQQPAVSTYIESSTPKSAVFLQRQPVVSTYIESSTPKSAVFLQKQPAVVSSYSYTAPSTIKPALIGESVISYTPKPVVTKKQPAVVSSYSFSAQPAKTVEFAGYDYPKPAVSFVEAPTPVVATYENREPVEEVPFVAKKAYVTGGQAGSYQYTQQFNAVNLEQKPVVVESYQAPIQPVVSTTPVYEYRVPEVTNKVVISTTPRYEYQQEQYEVPQVANKVLVSTTPRYEYQQQQQYRVPQVTNKVVVSTTPRYEYEQQQYSVDSGYVYDKPAVQFEERPLVVQNYQAPVVSKTANSGSYYIENRPQIFQKVVTSTARPIVDYTYVQSTPKPTFSSTINSIITKQPFTFYDSRIGSTVRPVTYSTSLPVVETVTTSRPISKFSFSSFDDQYQVSKTVDDYVAPVQVTAPRVRVNAIPSVVTTSRPIAKYSFSSLDTEYQQNDNFGQVVENYVAPIEVSTPSRDYLPVEVSTSAPTESYLAPISVTTSAPEIITPAREYLPVRTRVKVTTSAPEIIAPSREYLPVRTRVRVTTPVSTDLSSDDDLKLVLNRKPVKIVKVARPKTIVKVNDFHPLLSAKLGAQCTCVSNSVKLRKKPIRIVVDDDDDDDGYVVDDSNEGVIVENYQYEPQKIVEITPTPEVYIKSTTNEIIEPSSTPAYSVRRRVRVRPVTSTVSPVTQAAELFVNNVVTPIADLSEGVVVNAVTDDLALAKEISDNKVSLQSGKFDRYGPGGLRSRNEKLQGTIDCQRAGLFRHPTQCNKFYACRWDCTKNRYTLHVFNCPVHLTFDNNLGACNWPSQGPACLENTLLPSD